MDLSGSTMYLRGNVHSQRELPLFLLTTIIGLGFKSYIKYVYVYNVHIYTYIHTYIKHLLS